MRGHRLSNASGNHAGPRAHPHPRMMLLCEGAREDPHDVKGMPGEAGSLGSLEDLGSLAGHRVFQSRQCQEG